MHQNGGVGVGRVCHGLTGEPGGGHHQGRGPVEGVRAGLAHELGAGGLDLGQQLGIGDYRQVDVLILPHGGGGGVGGLEDLLQLPVGDGSTGVAADAPAGLEELKGIHANNSFL